MANKIKQIVLPSRYHRPDYRQLHEHMGHLGCARVLELARQRFFWPKMAKDIEHYVRNVCSCMKDRRPVITMRAPAQSFKTGEPIQLISSSAISLPKKGIQISNVNLASQNILWCPVSLA